MHKVNKCARQSVTHKSAPASRSKFQNYLRTPLFWGCRWRGNNFWLKCCQILHPKWLLQCFSSFLGTVPSWYRLTSTLTRAVSLWTTSSWWTSPRSPTGRPWLTRCATPVEIAHQTSIWPSFNFFPFLLYMLHLTCRLSAKLFFTHANFMYPYPLS